MAIWPVSLPPPSKDGLSGTMGTNEKSRKTMSGRTYSVRYGSGSPDRWDVTFRLLKKHPLYGNQLDIFKTFFNVDLNIGVNWFSAWWIIDIFKYPDHKAKILGYPSETVDTASHKDVSVTLLIKKSSSCTGDVLYKFT